MLPICRRASIKYSSAIVKERTKKNARTAAHAHNVFTIDSEKGIEKRQQVKSKRIEHHSRASFVNFKLSRINLYIGSKMIPILQVINTDSHFCLII